MEPLYQLTVQTHDGFDPRDVVSFDLAAFLAAHPGPQGVPEEAQPS